MPPFRSVRALSLLLLLAAVALPSAASAVQITYEAIDLADVNKDEDLWLYRYELDEFPYPADYGLSIFFDLGSTSLLELSRPSAAGWSLLVVQPDPNLPDDGFFDALQLIQDPSNDRGFAVQFVWSGSGAPGAQSFIVYDGGFATVEAGITQLPEPTAAALLALGLGGLFALGRRS